MRKAGKKERAAAKERAQAEKKAPKGVSKKQRPKKKPKKTDDPEDVGVVAKKKKSFFAVAVGREPGIYSNAEEFEKQLSKFPNAKGRRFYTLAEAQRFLKANGNYETVTQKTKQIITQAAKAGAATDKAGNSIMFTTERTGLARGFTLGTVRFGGRSVISDAAKPVFAPTVRASGAPLPQHAALAALGEDRDEEATAAAAQAEPECEGKQRDAGALDDALEGSGRDDAVAEEHAEGGVGGKVIDVDDEEEKEDEDEDRAEAGDEEQQEEGDGDVVELRDSETDALDGADAVEEGGAAQRKPQGLDDDFIAFNDSDEGGEGAAGQAEAATGKPTVSPHMKAQAPAEAGVVREYDDDELPWYDANIHIESQSARLHNEIVELTSLLQPTAEEDAQRLEAKKLLQDVVREIFPGSSLEIFGSFATGLHLPTSDVDCVITDSTVAPSQAGNALTALGTALRGKEWVKDLEVIAKARVPIVKLFVMPWGLKFDISCGVGSGIPAAGYIRKQLEQWPPLKPLVTILKLFLLQRNMNEVYTGGLGSFALILSLVAFLKMHTSRLPWREGVSHAQQLDCNLGVLLIDYFRFFGRQLAVTKIGVACGGDTHAAGCYVKARVFQPSMDRRDRGDRLSIRDPMDDSNDVSRGAFNSTAVRYAFDHAYHMLTHQPSELADMNHVQLLDWRGMSRLAWILRLDEVLAIRPPPPRKGIKRARTMYAPHVAPGHYKPPSPKGFISAKKSPPKPLPRPTKRNSSGSGGVDKFFGREEVSRGHGDGAGAPRVHCDAGGAPRVVTGHHGGHRGAAQRGGPRGGSGYQQQGGGNGGYRGQSREWGHDSGGIRGGYRRQGDSSNDGWRPVRH